MPSTAKLPGALTPAGNVSVKVSAVIYFRVVDPERAIIQVENYLVATSQLAQTTLRSVLGKHELDQMLAERDKLNIDIQHVLDQQTDAWGIKVATVGNPGMHLPTILGAIPGMSWVATKMMARKMEKLDIPPVPEFVEMIADSGAGVYGCKATVDMFGLGDEDFVPQVTGVLTVGEFYELAAGGEIVFT